MHGVYKYEVDGKVIYIGKTSSDFAARIGCHRRQSTFAPYLRKAKIFVHETKSDCEADFLETLLINQYKPELNTAKKGVTDIEIWANLQWVPWEEYNVKCQRKVAPKKHSHSFYFSDNVWSSLVKRSKKDGKSTSMYLDELLKGAFGL